MKLAWLDEFCRLVRDCGGRALLVGGCVRDHLLRRESKDFDIEIYGVGGAPLRALLEATGAVNAVGEQFTVYKYRPHAAPDLEVDVSSPRRESKSGRGHRGFVIEGDPHMSFEEATRRRDFTVNAILLDPLTDEIIDPQGGRADLTAGVLRAVHPTTFVEDSLRVLRAAQFAARFELTIAPETVALCRAVPLDDLPTERIWGELEKLLLRAARPSLGFAALNDLGVVDKLFPEIAALRGCPQEPEWHPEGDVWTHTLLCLDEAAPLIADLPKEKRVAVMLGVLAHDFGKPATTEFRDGRIRSPAHDEVGVALTERFLDRLGVYTMQGYDVRAQVTALVREHLRPGQFYLAAPPISDGAFRRLARKVDPDLLYRVAKADSLGRTPPARSSHMQEWFIEKMRNLNVENGAPKPLLLGRHLLAMGCAPGPRIGAVIRAVYDLQLDGAVTSLADAQAAARRLLHATTLAEAPPEG